MDNEATDNFREKAMRKRCRLLMKPPKVNDTGYQLYQEDPGMYQDTFGCPCEYHTDCPFKEDNGYFDFRRIV